MMKLKTILTELFDSKPYKFTKNPDVDGDNWEQTHIYEFKSDKTGIEYVIGFKVVFVSPFEKEINYVEIFYNDKESSDAGIGTKHLTGANEIPQIMATVVAATRDFFEQAKENEGIIIPKFIFSGDIKGEESPLASDNARFRVYTAVMNKVLPNGWKTQTWAGMTKIFPKGSPVNP